MVENTKTELSEPTSDITWIKENVQTIHGIGTFKDSKEENCQHYGSYA